MIYILLLFAVESWVEFERYPTLEACQIAQQRLIQHELITEALCCGEEYCIDGKEN